MNNLSLKQHYLHLRVSEWWTRQPRKIERHYLMSIIDSFLSMEATLMPSWWISTPESAPLCVEVVDTSWYNDRLIDNNRSQNPGWNRSAVLGNLEWGLNQVLHPDLCIEKVRLEVKSSNLGFQDTQRYISYIHWWLRFIQPLVISWYNESSCKSCRPSI